MDVNKKRSPRVREILDDEPSWIIMYGTLVLTLLLLVLGLLIAWLIKPYLFEVF